MRKRIGIGSAVLLGALFLASPIRAEEMKLSGPVIIEKVSSHPFPATDAKLQAAIKGGRMIVVGEPNYQMMQRMVGRERRPSKAYFIFRPDLGIPIFDNDYAAAMEIPLKLLLFEREDNKTVIRYKQPSSVLTDYRGLAGLGKELDELLAKLTDAATK